MFISRPNITCLSIGPSDHSFVGEDHLETVFGALANAGIHVRMMQNSAVQFDLVYDTDVKKEERFLEELGSGFLTKTELGLELLTIRHGSKELIEKLTAGREVVMEQSNAPTVRRLLR